MRITNLIQQNWVLLITVLVFLLPTFLIEADVLRHTNGVFSYPLDDSFIHLAIGKNLAFDQAWGLSSYEFVATSSSLLYPMLLAVVFFIFGAHIVIAFFVNLLVGIVVLVVIQVWLAKQRISPLYQLAILLGVIFLTPLPIIVVCGAEYTLQLLFGFLFIMHWWEEWTVFSPTFPKRLCIYGALLVATRYESLALVAVASLIVLFRRRWLLSLRLMLWSLLPLLISGLIVVSKDTHSPNYSIVLQTLSRSFDFQGVNFLPLLPFSYLIGSMIAIAGVTLAVAFHHLRAATSWAAFLVSFLFLLVLLLRGKNTFQEIVQASTNIYYQEYQVGEFLHRYYKQGRIAFAGTRTVSYFSEGWKIDLAGLNLTPDSLYHLNKKRHIELAVCIDNRYNSQLLRRWAKIASWIIHKNVVHQETTISIYAVDSEERKLLYENLRDFETHLTKETVTKYYYTPPPDTAKPKTRSGLLHP